MTGDATPMDKRDERRVSAMMRDVWPNVWADLQPKAKRVFLSRASGHFRLARTAGSRDANATIAAQETAIHNLKAEVAELRAALRRWAIWPMTPDVTKCVAHYGGDIAIPHCHLCVGEWQPTCQETHEEGCPAALAKIDAALKEAGDG